MMPTKANVRKVIYKTDEEIELMRASNEIVSKTLAALVPVLKAGVTGKQLDVLAEEFIRDNKGRPAFKGYGSFPASLCISVNEAVVHGIPNDKPFQDGDIISIDCGVELNGFYGDAAYTFALGNVREEVMHLLRVTKTSLYRAIEQAVDGKRLGDIGFAIEDFVQREHRYTVVRELVGHGVGRSLHEAPDVCNYGRRGNGMKLQDGLVIAIEPMINMGTRDIAHLNDNWTVVTADRKPSAHYEHSVAVRKNKADVLSSHQYLETAILANSELKEISLL